MDGFKVHLATNHQVRPMESPLHATLAQRKSSETLKRIQTLGGRISIGQGTCLPRFILERQICIWFKVDTSVSASRFLSPNPIEVLLLTQPKFYIQASLIPKSQPHVCHV